MTLSLTVMPAEAGTHDTLQRGCALRGAAPVDTCVDGRLRGHDGMEKAAVCR
jgi:hypothetical protein